jgi:pyruvate formate lyase activating enzyme
LDREAMLYSPGEDGSVVCGLCAHRCRIGEDKSGTCAVKQNRGGRLYSLVYGNIIAAHVDPIEKKPLYHVYPGSLSFSIATMGCNFRCSFCQNWQISQASKGEAQTSSDRSFPPEDVVEAAKAQKCRTIAYTYTEPTIYFEYAFDTARLAREEGLANVFVTNGYMTAEALEAAQPWLDACNVDLKSFRDGFYKKMCGARLEPVLESIRLMKKLGIWVEVTTLVIPGQNDSAEELTDIARFIAGVDTEIPWHISRFHPDYHYTSASPTPRETLRLAYGIGRQEGLKYIYIGNILGESEDTVCPSCGKSLIKRSGFTVTGMSIDEGRCPGCGQKVAGLF